MTLTPNLTGEVGGVAKPKAQRERFSRHPALSMQNKRLHAPPRHNSNEERLTYAALDLGTNNCRLLIAKPDNGTFRVVDSFSRIVRLGEGLAASKELSLNAMDRAVEALKICREKIEYKQVHKLGLIATEACRQALNGSDFLERVKREAGLDLKIISRRTEARLAAVGCSPLLDTQAKGVILFDIGGGSSEIVWVSARTRKFAPPLVKMHDWASLPVGVVTMAERFGGKLVTRESYKAMVEEGERLIARFASRLPRGEALDGMMMLGTSGTVTTLAGLHLDLPRYERRLIDGIWLEGSEIDAVTNNILNMNYEARQNNACIGMERADLVLAGCAILQAIRNQFPIPRLRVADRGLREGVLYEMIHNDFSWGGLAS